MKQLSLAATDFVKKPKQTRREKFLLEMESVSGEASVIGDGLNPPAAGGIAQ